MQSLNYFLIPKWGVFFFSSSGGSFGIFPDTIEKRTLPNASKKHFQSRKVRLVQICQPALWLCKYRSMPNMNGLKDRSYLASRSNKCVAFATHEKLFLDVCVCCLLGNQLAPFIARWLFIFSLVIPHGARLIQRGHSTYVCAVQMVAMVVNLWCSTRICSIFDLAMIIMEIPLNAYTFGLCWLYLRDGMLHMHTKT